jgi:hypothetical protein
MTGHRASAVGFTNTSRDTVACTAIAGVINFFRRLGIRLIYHPGKKKSGSRPSRRYPATTRESKSHIGERHGAAPYDD